MCCLSEVDIIKSYTLTNLIYNLKNNALSNIEWGGRVFNLGLTTRVSIETIEGPSFSQEMQFQTSNHQSSFIASNSVSKNSMNISLKNKFVFPASFFWLMRRRGSNFGTIFSKSSYAIVYNIKYIL